MALSEVDVKRKQRIQKQHRNYGMQQSCGPKMVVSEGDSQDRQRPAEQQQFPNSKMRRRAAAFSRSYLGFHCKSPHEPHIRVQMRHIQPQSVDS